MRAPQHYASALQLTRRVINCSRLWIRRYCTSARCERAKGGVAASPQLARYAVYFSLMRG